VVKRPSCDGSSEAFDSIELYYTKPQSQLENCSKAEACEAREARDGWGDDELLKYSNFKLASAVLHHRPISSLLSPSQPQSGLVHRCESEHY